ncbi:MAG TPA: hypothetical protein VF189_00565 [Patescibacteria group bacterium]
MSVDINLLPQKSRSKLSQEQLLTYSKIGAVISSIVTVTFAVVIFLLNRDPSLAQIQAQEQTILSQLTILHNKTAKNLIILDRVKRIEKIVQTRKTLDKDITSIQKQLPENADVTTFSLDGQHLIMTISAQSLFPLGNFVESMTKDITTKTLIKKVTIEGIISDEKTGNFLLSINADLL